MTITEREEDREKVTNATIEQIKEKEEEEEEEEKIDQTKKEEEDDEELNLDTMLSEIVKDSESESSMKEMKEHEEQVSKRTRNAESGEVEEAKEAETEQLRIGSDPAVDPLDITMEIVSKYHDFVDFALEILEEEQKYEEEEKYGEEQKIEEEMKTQLWSEVFERGKQLVESLKQRLQRLPNEMDRMKNDNNLQEEYTTRKFCVQHILPQMRHLNSRVDTSPHIRIVPGENTTVRVLPLYFDELHDCKIELFAMMELIRNLKEGNEEDEYADEDGEEIRVESE